VKAQVHSITARMPVSDERIADAMQNRCGICRAEPLRPCRNLQQRELPQGTVHFYRIEPK
jgi:hypothetical protein